MNLTEIASTATITDTVDYPATCYILIEGDSPITLPEGTRIAIERRKHRGYRMFSNHQIGYDEKEGAYGFALATCLSDSPGEKVFRFALTLGQLVKIAGKVYRLEDAPNQNIKFTAI
jgi:hypothetical protein